MIDRRTFTGSVAGSLFAAALGVRAQKSAKPVVGFVHLASADSWWMSNNIAAFRQGLAEVGFIDGKNVAIEFRWADHQHDRVPALLADLVHLEVAVIVTVGGPRTARRAQAATSRIPIVFVIGGDATAYGLVATLGQPGGNATGITNFTTDLVAKRIELLLEMMPGITGIGLISNRDSDEAARAQEAARSLGQHLHVLNASTVPEIDAAFGTLKQLRAGALIVGKAMIFDTRRDQFIALAERHAIPAIYHRRDFVTAGGLFSYGASIPGAYRSAGIYAGKILNGAKPADLPVLRPTKIELVINLKTAKTLGITIPESLLLHADELIQ